MKSITLYLNSDEQLLVLQSLNLGTEESRRLSAKFGRAHNPDSAHWYRQKRDRQSALILKLRDKRNSI